MLALSHLFALLRRAALPALAALPLATAAQVDVPVAQALQRQAARPEMPTLALGKGQLRGQQAVQALGSRLADVAAHYRKSPEQFRALLLNDRRLRLDREGRLFVEEELDAANPAPIGNAAAEPLSGVVDGGLYTLDQTFLLHSRPGAKRTVYLNFKGAVLSNTAWNSNGSSITALPFDIDGVPYTFSTTELQRIQYIWQRVAEDFAPFDVDVTTEPPPADKLTYSGGSDTAYGTTALITSRSGVYSCSCGGVAYVGVFDGADRYKPALVFHDALSGNEKSIAEAISHEVGHNLGLQHDGNASTAYYAGHGSGATGWAPIMGVGYSRPLSQWSKGEYAGANNAQDDVVVMQQNGVTLRADDHGGTTGTATPLQPVAAGGLVTFAAQGIIERPGDLDYFAFTSAPGSVSFTITPAARGPNLDARLELRNAAGVVLASANPAEAINAALTATLAAGGTYYIVVQGTGKGDPLTTGYSSYGSLGHYALAGSAPLAGSVAPTAVLTATPVTGTAPLVVNFSSAGSADADGTISAIDWTFGDGTSASGATASHTYSTAGSYTAQLRVTDNAGLSATRSVTITVNPPVATPQMGVSNIAMLLVSNWTVASVNVKDAHGNPVAGAVVSGAWSNLTASSATATTDATGKANLRSTVATRRGTFVFTVTGITRSGYSYAPALNVETSDSIVY